MNYNIMTEYNNMTENLAVLESRLHAAKRELLKLEKSAGPAGELPVISWGEHLKTTFQTLDTIEVALAIAEAKEKIETYKSEIEFWKVERNSLEATINSYGDLKRKVLMLKLKGLKHAQIAKELGYSKERIDQVSCQIKKELQDYNHITTGSNL